MITLSPVLTFRRHKIYLLLESVATPQTLSRRLYRRIYRLGDMFTAVITAAFRRHLLQLDD